MSIGLHKEPSLKARLELFATNTTVLEMRWQHVPNLGCRDAETARTVNNISDRCVLYGVACWSISLHFNALKLSKKSSDVSQRC